LLKALKLAYPTVFEEPKYPMKRDNTDEDFAHKIRLLDEHAQPPRKKLYPLD
jgi:hypothetical protein